MKLLIDKNMSNRRLASVLQAQGHDSVLAADAGLLSVTDAKVFTWATVRVLPVLTRDYEDFADLHDLVSSSGGRHGGLLVVRFDNDSRHNLTDRGIASALSKLESANVPIADQIHILNHWR